MLRNSLKLEGCTPVQEAWRAKQGARVLRCGGEGTEDTECTQNLCQFGRTSWPRRTLCCCLDIWPTQRHKPAGCPPGNKMAKLQLHKSISSQYLVICVSFLNHCHYPKFLHHLNITYNYRYIKSLSYFFIPLRLPTHTILQSNK